MTRINHGWTISNGLGVIWPDGEVDQVLLDQNHLCFPDPNDVCITPDGRLALVTSSTSDRVAVVDLDALVRFLKNATPEQRSRVIPNHTGYPANYVMKTISVPAVPRGIVCSPDGAVAYTASMLDDSVAAIDLERLELVARIDLGGPAELTKRRRGEKRFTAPHHLPAAVSLAAGAAPRPHRQHRLRNRRRWRRMVSDFDTAPTAHQRYASLQMDRESTRA